MTSRLLTCIESVLFIEKRGCVYIIKTGKMHKCKEINVKKQPSVKTLHISDVIVKQTYNFFNLTSFIISKSLLSKDQQKGQ